MAIKAGSDDGKLLEYCPGFDKLSCLFLFLPRSRQGFTEPQFALYFLWRTFEAFSLRLSCSQLNQALDTSIKSSVFKGSPELRNERLEHLVRLLAKSSASQHLTDELRSERRTNLMLHITGLCRTEVEFVQLYAAISLMSIQEQFMNTPRTNEGVPTNFEKC
jgi:hypothetical protein